MAHEIVNEQMAYVGETPWHGLGARLDESATPEDFLVAAKLNWTMDRTPLYLKHSDEEGDTFTEVEDKFGFVRSTDKKLMTIAGKTWKPFQNKDLIAFMDRYVKAGGAKMETVGALRDGKVVWGLAKLNHSFETRPGDRTEGYILLTSPHEVGSSISLRTTTVRVVCANTMAMANSEGSVHYKQSHMKEFDVNAAKEMVEAAHETLAEAERRSKTLDRLKITMEDAVTKVLAPVFMPELLEDEESGMEMLKNILNGVENMPKALGAILTSVEQAPGAIPDTAWGILNGVTHYADHVAGNSRDSRMMRSWMGDLAKAKLDVQDRLLELC